MCDLNVYTVRYGGSQVKPRWRIWAKAQIKIVFRTPCSLGQVRMLPHRQIQV
jgi:hypothetical protein